MKHNTFASKGVISRIKGQSIDKHLDVFSTLERNFVLVLEERFKNISDIKTYYKLPLDETLKIAQDLKIIHPGLVNGKKALEMRTNFLLIFNENSKIKQMAVNVSYKNELKNKRKKEKISIEKEYWRRKGVEFQVITEEEISSELVKNIIYLRNLKEPNPKERMHLYKFRMFILSNPLSVVEACTQYSKNNELKFEEVYYLFLLLIKEDLIPHDLSQAINNEKIYYDPKYSISVDDKR